MDAIVLCFGRSIVVLSCSEQGFPLLSDAHEKDIEVLGRGILLLRTVGRMGFSIGFQGVRI